MKQAIRQKYKGEKKEEGAEVTKVLNAKLMHELTGGIAYEIWGGNYMIARVTQLSVNITSMGKNMSLNKLEALTKLSFKCRQELVHPKKFKSILHNERTAKDLPNTETKQEAD